MSADDTSDLTVKEAAKDLKVCEDTIWKLIREGAFQTYKVGRVRRIERASFNAWRISNRVEYQSPARSFERVRGGDR